VLARGSTSFAAAARLLPRRVRDPATAVYAFCRIADDLIDGVGAHPDAVDALRMRLDRVYEDDPERDFADRAFARVVAAHALPRALPQALLDGLEWDAGGRRYESFDDLCAYAVRVAGSVGLMMAWLMRRRDAVTLARACDLGVAMQLTNIARDVGQDARAGRFYLPLRWVRRASVDVEAFMAQPRFTPELGSVVARLLRAADALYWRADGGVARLPLDCRLAIRAARLVYAAIGREIRRAGFDSVSRRAVVSTAQRVALLARATGVVVRRSGPEDAPWLEPARALIENVAD
jgi:15-cis-phytoene synthase